jgi:hypothetical protein
MTDMKLSVVRRWKNGATLSVDNLEPSGIMILFFLVREILLIKRSRRPFCVARLLRQLIDYINRNNLKLQHC